MLADIAPLAPDAQQTVRSRLSRWAPRRRGSCRLTPHGSSARPVMPFSRFSQSFPLRPGLRWTLVLAAAALTGCVSVPAPDLQADVPPQWNNASRGAAAPREALFHCGGTSACRSGAGTLTHPVSAAAARTSVHRRPGRRGKDCEKREKGMTGRAEDPWGVRRQEPRRRGAHRDRRDLTVCWASGASGAISASTGQAIILPRECLTEW